MQGVIERAPPPPPPRQMCKMPDPTSKRRSQTVYTYLLGVIHPWAKYRKINLLYRNSCTLKEWLMIMCVMYRMSSLTMSCEVCCHVNTREQKHRHAVLSPQEGSLPVAT
jgi:hypothetical protein